MAQQLQKHDDRLEQLSNHIKDIEDRTDKAETDIDCLYEDTKEQLRLLNGVAKTSHETDELLAGDIINLRQVTDAHTKRLAEDSEAHGRKKKRRKVYRIDISSSYETPTNLGLHETP